MSEVITSAQMNTYLRWPVEMVRGSGATLYDREGKSYIDLVAGIAVASLGHGHPALAAAIADQAHRLVHVSNLYETAPAGELAQRLYALTGMHSFFCNSGAEAVECALKLVRRRAHDEGRQALVVATDGGFHGRTFGALSLTGQPGKKEAFEPMLAGVIHVPYGDLAALRAVERFDALIVEPIQGEAGVIVPPPGYLRAVRALCDERNALLILDEVQTGLGRTGKWFAHEGSGAPPDIMCLAKGLGGGLPIGACLARPEVAEAFRPGDHGTTFGGGPVQCAAALAVLDALDEGLLGSVEEMGELLRSGLGAIFGSDAVRGAGLMLGVALDGPNARNIAARALEAGVLVNDIGTHVLRFTPPLVISRRELEGALAILEEVHRETRAPA